MKKLKSVFVIFNLLLLIFLTGCNSLPVGKTVDPINLLDNKSGFYIAIPKSADPQLVRRIVTKNVPNLTDKNVNMICDHTSKIYSGVLRNKKGSQIQTAIEGSIPINLIPRLLTEKNGWELRNFNSENSSKYHIVYNGNGVDLSFPGVNVACVGRDINYMLSKYDMISSTPDSFNELGEPVEEYYSDLPRNVYDFLKHADSEIRFYANKPKSFLTVLTGTNLDLQLIDVMGSFQQDPKHSDQYILNIYFKFRDNKFLKAGRALLNLAFGLTNSESEFIGDCGLNITGIKIGKDMLYKILMI